MVFERKELEVCIVLWNRVGLDLFLGSFFACVKFSRYGSLEHLIGNATEGRDMVAHFATFASCGLCARTTHAKRSIKLMELA